MTPKCRTYAALALALLVLVTPVFAKPGDKDPPGKGEDHDQGKALGHEKNDERTAREEKVRGFERWLTGAAETKAYRVVAREINAAVAGAIMAGVPSSVFEARILEAAARGTPPDRLVSALETDAGNWTYLAGLLDGAGWPPSKATPGFYLAAGTAMRNGLQPMAVKAAVAWAVSTSTDADRAGSAMVTASAVASALGMTDELAASLVVALASSRMPVSGFQSVAGLASRAAAAGIPAVDFCAAVVGALSAGADLDAAAAMIFP